MKKPKGKFSFKTPEWLAETIGFHVESVRRAIREGRIKTVVFGRFHRIPESEVERILKNGIPK